VHFKDLVKIALLFIIIISLNAGEVGAMVDESRRKEMMPPPHYLL